MSQSENDISFTPNRKHHIFSTVKSNKKVHHTGKADSLLHWHTSDRNFLVRISTSSRTRYARRSTFVIRRLQHIIRLKQGGVEIKISQPFASESCKHSKDNTEVMQGLLSTQWSLTFIHHHKETGNLNSTLYRSKLHLESCFYEEYLPPLFSHQYAYSVGILHFTDRLLVIILYLSGGTDCSHTIYKSEDLPIIACPSMGQTQVLMWWITKSHSGYNYSMVHESGFLKFSAKSDLHRRYN